MYQNTVAIAQREFIIMSMSFKKNNPADNAVSLDSAEILKSLPDTEIIEILYRNYSDYIYTIVREKMLSSKLPIDDVDDCFSHMILKLAENGCKKIRQFRGESSFKTFLTVACRNITIDYIRALIHKHGNTASIDANENVFSDLYASYGSDPFPDNPEMEYIRSEHKSLVAEAAGQVRKLIDKLDRREQLILKLRIDEGKTYHDIDRFLGIDNSAYLFSKIVHKIRNSIDSRLQRSIEELLMET